MDRVMFTATVQHPERGKVDLMISVPVATCWEHKPSGFTDEDTPTPPHVYSTSGYHTDYHVCLAAAP